jgi:hypothetical protein
MIFLSDIPARNSFECSGGVEADNVGCLARCEAVDALAGLRIPQLDHPIIGR